MLFWILLILLVFVLIGTPRYPLPGGILGFILIVLLIWAVVTRT